MPVCIREVGSRRASRPRIMTYPFFRVSVQVMIAKTIFFAKTFPPIRRKSFVRKKVFAITGQDEIRHTARRTLTAPPVTSATE
jgi:hypothetical protein